MDHVSCVEQLGNGGIDIFLGFLQSVLPGGEMGVVDVVEREILSAVWSVIGDVGITAIPVLVSESVVTPSNSRVANRRAVLETDAVRLRVVSDGQGVPTERTGKLVAEFPLNAALAFARIIDSPLEDVVGRERPAFLGNRGVGIGGPVDHRNDLVRRVGRDGSLVPVILHLNLELPNEIEVGGIPIRNLDVGQASLDGVDSLRDVIDEFDGDMGFVANEVTIHIRGHFVEIVVILGKDILNHVFLGGGGDHELEERMTRVL